MTKKGKSQYAILGMLAICKAASGYELKKHMESSTEFFWKETFSSIYPVLQDLKKQKLIEKVKGLPKSDRNATTYRLTPEGRQALENWLSQPPETEQLRNELLLKLFFGSMVPPQMILTHLQEHKKALEEKLMKYKEMKTQLSEIKTDESLYWLLTLEYGIAQMSASISWCEKAEEQLYE